MLPRLIQAYEIGVCVLMVCQCVVLSSHLSSQIVRLALSVLL